MERPPGRQKQQEHQHQQVGEQQKDIFIIKIANSSRDATKRRDERKARTPATKYTSTYNRNAYNSRDAILNWNVCKNCLPAVRHIKTKGKWYKEHKEHCEAFSLFVRQALCIVSVYSRAIHREYRVLGFLSSRPNWVSQPLTRKQVLLPPPPVLPGGETFACRGGGGGPNSDEGTDTTVCFSMYV
jgi:hypothetical protein